VKEIEGYQSVNVPNGGTISGKVLFTGDWKPVAIPVAKDQQVCGRRQQDPSLVLGGQGGVLNALVRITDIRKGKGMGGTQPVLDQKGCEYRPHMLAFPVGTTLGPHMLAFPVGTTLEILNSDGILHNVHSFSKKNTPFNKAQPKFRKKITHTFTEAEIVSIKCDVHSWMSGWLVISDHPYYDVTSEGGAFELANVPPGKYTVEVWHEVLGKQTKSVSVEPGGHLQLNFQVSQLSNP
jgi:plastocyanin